MHYNVIIIGGGPGGIFSAYELTKDRSDLQRRRVRGRSQP